MANQPQLASVTGWTNFLRRLWTIAPNKLVTAKAIVRMTSNQLGMLAEIRQKIRDEDLFWPEKAMHSWDAKFDELKDKMQTWLQAMFKDPTDAVATLIVPQIIYAPSRPGSEQGFKQPYIVELVSLYNQVVTQFDFVGKYVVSGMSWNWAADTLNEGKQEIFGNAAPGEDPTVRDKLGGAFDNALNNLDQFWEWTKKAAKVGLIAILALAGIYVATRAKRHNMPVTY